MQYLKNYGQFCLQTKHIQLSLASDLFNHQFTCNASLYIPVCTLHVHICEHTFMSQFERGGFVRNSHRSKLVIIHDCYNAKF